MSVIGTAVGVYLGRGVAARLACAFLAVGSLGMNRAAAQVPGPSQIQPGPAVPLVLQVPGMELIAEQRDLVYRRIGDTLLRADLYLPQARSSRDPAVIFISGASDFRGWRAFQDLARLAAINGIVGINFSKRFERTQILEGGEDLQALLRFLLEKSDSLGVDPNRVCLWGVSGGGTLLGVGIASQQVRCIVGLYAFVDVRQILPRFSESARAVARRLLSGVDLLDSLPASPPMLLVRAGLDQPSLNASIDSLTRHALDRNRSIELINYATGHHGFDLIDDTEESRVILRRAMQFVSDHLRGPSPAGGQTHAPGEHGTAPPIPRWPSPSRRLTGDHAAYRPRVSPSGDRIAVGRRDSVSALSRGPRRITIVVIPLLPVTHSVVSSDGPVQPERRRPACCSFARSCTASRVRCARWWRSFWP